MLYNSFVCFTHNDKKTLVTNDPTYQGFLAKFKVFSSRMF